MTLYPILRSLSGEPLKSIRRADDAHQPGITDPVTLGRTNRAPPTVTPVPMLPLKQQCLAVIHACITPMYRRYGPDIIITIIVAPHHAFVIK